jgi:hypothetical protein
VVVMVTIGEKRQQGLLGSKSRKFKRLRGGRASKLRYKSRAARRVQ